MTSAKNIAKVSISQQNIQFTISNTYFLTKLSFTNYRFIHVAMEQALLSHCILWYWRNSVTSHFKTTFILFHSFTIS